MLSAMMNKLINSFLLFSFSFFSPMITLLELGVDKSKKKITHGFNIALLQPGTEVTE